MSKKTFSSRLAYFLWDLWCIISIIGIWPRFIEPKLISTTRKKLALPNLPEDLNGLRLVQFSDLHFGPHVSDRYLRKLHRKIHQLNPDLILFTGDFLCCSKPRENERLQSFLKTFQAKRGCFASMGNHDYASYASLEPNGKPVIGKSSVPPIFSAFKRLFSSQKPAHQEQNYPTLELHPDLTSLLADTPFTLLNNESKLVKVNGSAFSVTGLGDLWAGNFKPEKAYLPERAAFSLTLTHNPDTAMMLKEYPTDLLLSGHTHGAQMNLPWFRSRFIALRNQELFRGEHRIGDKTLYVNRGCGSVFTFRWFSMPEVTFYELESQS